MYRLRAVLLALTAAAVVAVPATAAAQPLTGLTKTGGAFNCGLVTFDTATPGTLSAVKAITGLDAGDQIIAIDRNPNNGILYGLGKKSFMYQINEQTGAATHDGPVFSTPLTSESVVADIDFDPRFTAVARITTDTDQNLVWQSGATSAKTAISWAAPHAADNPAAVALAYSNNFPGGPTPIPYVYDVGDDQFAYLGTQGNEANTADNGKLTALGPNTGLSTNTTVGGLDIAPDGTKFALLRSGGFTQLYTFDTAAGTATPVSGSPATSKVGDGSDTVIDIAADSVHNNFSLSAAGYSVGESDGKLTVTVTRSQSIGAANVNYTTSDGTAKTDFDYRGVTGTLFFANGETTKTVDIAIRSDVIDESAETFTFTLMNPQGGSAQIVSPGAAAVGIEDDDTGPLPSTPVTILTSTNELLTLDSATPGTVSAPLPVTGLQAGEELVAIDRRPATGQLYAMTKQSRLYTIDESSGAATQVGSGQFAPPLAGGNGYGFDFDPVADSIRAVSQGNGQNLSINPNDGTVTPQAPLIYDAADPKAGSTPDVVALAYTNSVPGAADTTLFGYEYTQDNMLRIGSPGGSPVAASTGDSLTIGKSGISASDPANVGMDVAPDGTGWGLMRESGGLTTRLNTINFTTGVVNLVGVVGGGTDIYRDLALPPVTNVVQVGADSVSAGEAAPATVTVTRSQTFGAATVDYATSDGSATAGSDYTATSGTLTFAAGEASKQISIPVTNDSAVEGPETLKLTLSNPKGGRASLGVPAAATVTIADNDVALPPDKTPPVVSTCHKSKQKLLKQKAVLACVKSSEAGSASVSGKLKIRGVKKALALKKVSGAVKAGVKRTLKLKLSSKARAALKKHGGKGSVKLTIKVRDAAANETRLARTVKATK